MPNSSKGNDRDLNYSGIASSALPAWRDKRPKNTPPDHDDDDDSSSSSLILRLPLLYCCFLQPTLSVCPSSGPANLFGPDKPKNLPSPTLERRRVDSHSLIHVSLYIYYTHNRGCFLMNSTPGMWNLKVA